MDFEHFFSIWVKWYCFPTKLWVQRWKKQSEYWTKAAIMHCKMLYYKRLDLDKNIHVSCFDLVKWPCLYELWPTLFTTCLSFNSSHSSVAVELSWKAVAEPQRGTGALCLAQRHFDTWIEVAGSKTPTRPLIFKSFYHPADIQITTQLEHFNI